MPNRDPFETTVQKTNLWLSDILKRVDLGDRHRAWVGLRAVLHVLRDRLTTEEAVALGAQLPMLVRGAYYEGWRPHQKPDRIKHEWELFERVTQELGRGYDDVDTEKVTRAVLAVLGEHVSVGEMDHLSRILPTEISRLLTVD